MNQSNSNLSRRQVVAAIGAFGGRCHGLDRGARRSRHHRHQRHPEQPERSPQRAVGTHLSACRQGQELALEQINKRGGVHGRKVRIKVLDDAYDPKKAVENLNRLIDDDKVVALYGLASTGTVCSVLPILAEKKVPLVSLYTGSPTLRVKHHPYFFTTVGSYRDEVAAMIRNPVTLQRTQIAVLWGKSPFGQLMLPVVEELAKELGATIVAKASLEPDGSDAVAAAQTLGAAKPQGVIFIAFGPSMIPFVRAARQHIGAPVYAVSIANSIAIIAALGDDARGLAFTQLIPYSWRVTTPLGRDFNAAMEAANIPLDYDHFFGTLNMRVLLEGMRRGGKNVSSQSIVTGMQSMSKTDLGGYVVDFSPTNHLGSKFVDITIVGPGGRFIG
jgi:ABC-type branched-subunit amino acid transport system substrate-binding protein